MSNNIAMNFAVKAREYAEKARLEKMTKLEDASKACVEVLVKMLDKNECYWNTDFTTVSFSLRGKADMISSSEQLAHVTEKLKQMGFRVNSHTFYSDDYYITGLDTLDLSVIDQ